MPLETIEEVVDAGVKAQAAIDRHLAAAYKAAAQLTKVTERGVALGMVQGIGAKKIIGDARAAQGHVAAVASVFAQLHHVQTEACKAAGMDMGSVTSAGGVLIGGVSTMGGGR